MIPEPRAGLEIGRGAATISPRFSRRFFSSDSALGWGAVSVCVGCSAAWVGVDCGVELCCTLGALCWALASEPEKKHGPTRSRNKIRTEPTAALGRFTSIRPHIAFRAPTPSIAEYGCVTANHDEKRGNINKDSDHQAPKAPRQYYFFPFHMPPFLPARSLLDAVETIKRSWTSFGELSEHLGIKVSQPIDRPNLERPSDVATWDSLYKLEIIGSQLSRSRGFALLVRQSSRPNGSPPSS